MPFLLGLVLVIFLIKFGKKLSPLIDGYIDNLIEKVKKKENENEEH